LGPDLAPAGSFGAPAANAAAPATDRERKS